MFKQHPNVIVLRGILVAVCLAVLGGCGSAASISTATKAAASVPATPATPSGLSATAGNAVATLTWTASSGATSYNVKRATISGGPYTQLAAPTSTGYKDSAVTNGTAYYYVVSSLDETGESANSAEASATPKAPSSGPPAVPTNLQATAGNAEASLTWSANATSYHVKRATTSGGPYTQVAAPTSTSYTDTALANGTTYFYVVSALTSAGESANSAQASAAPVAPPPSIPATPTGQVATPGNADVVLNWSASSGATSYHVKRATTSGGPYSQVGAPTSTSYTDTSLTNGTTYYYVISALDSVGESANSTQISAVPAVPNPPPTTFGTWTNVTPTSIDLVDALSCSNYGTEAVQVDPAHPSNLYVEFNCQGIYKSTDYGATWSGPINTGSNGALVTDCAGGITISPTSTATVPTIYESCIRGTGIGFWKSVDGGVNWTRYVVAPSGTSRQDYYPAVVDPYDSNHLLMCGHEQNFLVQSVDGGKNWTNVSMNSGMVQNGGTCAIFFINTGNAATTRTTWLWLAQVTGGLIGTWRTANSGAAWVQVDKNEHPHGSSEIYQPDNNGVVYMAGLYSTFGWGVLKSGDYGQTWSHVGIATNETVVWGTSKNVYAMYGWPIGAGQNVDPTFELGAQPGNGTWVKPGTPAGLTQGPGQVTVVNDGTHNIFLGAMFNGGLWRYIEP